MLTHLRIKNFKAWKDTGPVRLAPLTIIFGPNSSGKSSLGHLLLALKQTALSSDRRRVLHLGDDDALVDLGTFAECIHKHDITKPFEFDIGWRLAKDVIVDNPWDEQRFYGSDLHLSVSLLADRHKQPRVQSLRYCLRDRDAPPWENQLLEVAYKREENGKKYKISSDQYVFARHARNIDRKWPSDEPDKFYILSGLARSRFQNADFLSDVELETEASLGRIFHLGPLREHPKRIYSWTGNTPDSVGQKGELTIASILAARIQGRKLNRGPKTHYHPFEEFIALWLKDMGIIDSFSVRQLSGRQREYEVILRTHGSAPPVTVPDVGFGVSQVLPVLVEVFYCEPHATIWMEQPEIHLHPQVQAELADVFISAIKAKENNKERNVQLIVESHSEHLLVRLQRRVAEGSLSLDDVAVYFCHRVGARAVMEPLRLNADGDIENWPERFFGDEMAEISGRVLAAMRKKNTTNAEGGKQ